MKVAKKDLLQIAQVMKSNGIDGETIISMSISPDDIRKEQPVYLIFDELPVPFFIESIKRKGTSKAVVKFVDIDNFDDSEEIVGKAVYAEKHLYSHMSEEEDLIDMLVGWTLFDGEGYEIGQIENYLDIPSNPCITVNYNGEEKYIPFHEDLIIAVDEENCEIQMEIPDSLLD